MASVDHTAYEPLASGFMGSLVSPAGHVTGAYQWTFSVATGTRVGRSVGAMLSMRVRSPTYFLRGQFGGVTETWIGGSPDTPPPSGHAVTDRSFTVLDF